MIADAIIKYLKSIGHSYEATLTPYGSTFYFHQDKDTAKKVFDYLKELGYNDINLNCESYVDGEINGLRPGEYNYYITWRE